jgi:hypothetical protein
MNILLKMSVLTSVIGLAVVSAHADAAVVDIYSEGNAAKLCQAFTPGPANTIRNRVTGSENVGATMNVACAFDNTGRGSATYTKYVAVGLYNNSGATISVTCAMLGGYFGHAGTVVSKTVNIAAAGGTSISFTAADTLDPADTDLGGWQVGINCTLPTGGVITWTRSRWQDEDGVGV